MIEYIILISSLGETKMALPEILAPAGSKEQLEAAVRSGTDAVYFGASSFNARRNAQNFTDEDFLSAVKYCRERGVKAYITLNTLVKNSEMEEFEKTLELIAKSGADAVIIQDMAALSLIKKCCPDIPVHASTQMAVHNKSGARLLEEAGFSRIVLARELSIKEIKAIKEAVNTEIEVFVHGAHCMSASGMCYISSVLGARSGNRGLCAQPCRLNFRHKSREFALSLKDMCLLDEITELKEAGITSFKIEGRMKRPEYVSSAVKAYKTALAGGKADTFVLQSVFSRSGFTNGYAMGKRDISMFGYRTKDDVLAAQEVLSGIANEYRNENPLVAVTMKFTAKAGKEAQLLISDSENTVCVKGATPENALKTPLSEESAVRSLGKLGSTFYYPTKIHCDIDDGLMLRASDINSMRREATDRLTEIRGKITPYSFTPSQKSITASAPPLTPEVRLMFREVSLMPEKLSADMIILPVKEILSHKEIIEKYDSKLCAALPALIYPHYEDKLSEELKLLFSLGVTKAYCDNIGAVAIAKNARMKAYGGTLLNVINSEAVNMYRDFGVEDIALSPEISLKELKNIKSHSKTGIMVYGYMPLMHFRCCPLQGEKGCGECTGKGILTDRMNEDFTVLCENKQYSVLYNTVPLYVGDKSIPPVSFILLKFTTETASQTERIIHGTINKKALAGKKTAGLYEREII